MRRVVGVPLTLNVVSIERSMFALMRRVLRARGW
jgi:hypothetical protein